jgi:hypothetical protein
MKKDGKAEKKKRKKEKKTRKTKGQKDAIKGTVRAGAVTWTWEAKSGRT